MSKTQSPAVSSTQATDSMKPWQTLNYTGEHNNLTIGAGTLQEYGQFLGASGTGAYQLSDATSISPLPTSP